MGTKPKVAQKQQIDKNEKETPKKEKQEFKINGKDVDEIIGHSEEQPRESFTREEVYDIIARLSQYFYDTLLSGKSCLVYERRHYRDTLNHDEKDKDSVDSTVQDSQLVKQNHDMVGSLYGQMMSIMETAFSDIKQQNASKSLVRNIFNHTVNDNHNYMEKSLNALFHDPYGVNMSRDMRHIRNILHSMFI